MNKLYRARSLLYRRQILQVNIRWKALDEIHKIYMLLHRSDLNIFQLKSCKQVKWTLSRGLARAAAELRKAAVSYICCAHARLFKAQFFDREYIS